MSGEFSSQTQQKPKDHFSRRHQGPQAHTDAQLRKEAKLKAQQDKHQANEVAQATRTPNQQIKRLDTFFGKGKGAQRERKRLGDLIAQGKGDVPIKR